MIKKIINYIILILLICFTLSACTNAKSKNDEKNIIIAEQFGLAYAPVQIMKEKGFLDDELSDYKIEWVKLANTTAIREAILADKLDVGFLGIPPFLIGHENGMDWKIFSGLSSSPLGLVSNDGEIKSIKDIKETDRIALPQPGSIQHILLSMAAKDEFDDAKYFDKQLVTMKHPDGMSALLSKGDVKLHFTSPPYLFEELKEEDTSLVIDGDECFGEKFTFIVGMTTKKMYEDKDGFEGLSIALDKSIKFINENREESLIILSNYYDYDKETLEEYLYDSGIEYTSELNGIDRFIEFMNEAGYLEELQTEEELTW